MKFCGVNDSYWCVRKFCIFFFLSRLKNASFEIVPADSGVFEVSAKFMGIPMEKVEIVFQVSLFSLKYVVFREEW